MQEIKNKVEVVLFTTGRFLTVEEIARLCNLNENEVIPALESLKSDYSSKDSSLEIIQESNRYKLNIKKQYLYLTTSLLSEVEMDKPTQQTLALIAYKNPAMQSEIIKMRSNSAYDHIKKLKEQEFITSEKYGRTRLLKLTQKFYDYFDIIEDQIKEKLK